MTEYGSTQFSRPVTLDPHPWRTSRTLDVQHAVGLFFDASDDFVRRIFPSRLRVVHFDFDPRGHERIPKLHRRLPLKRAVAQEARRLSSCTASRLSAPVTRDGYDSERRG